MVPQPPDLALSCAMLIAITRPVSRSFAGCELTYLPRATIDPGLAQQQHERYERALEAAGCTVHRLRAEPDLPDAVFVEDAAIVLDEVAILTRPGAPSRRAEVASVAETLGAWRPLAHIQAPGTIDGGDVLRVGRHIWVGRSSRTNEPGFEQLCDIATPLGYKVHPVWVRGCLHLKSAVTAIGRERLLGNPAWIPPGTFDGFALVEVHPDEPLAANALQVGDSVICAATFPRTTDRLRAQGIEPVLVDVSEIAKAEGALTCCSLIVEQHGAGTQKPGAGATDE